MEIDVVKEISELNNRDIIIVMDGSKHWSEHVKSMTELKTLDLFYEIKVSQLPKSNKGNKCYLTYNNKIYAQCLLIDQYKNFHLDLLFYKYLSYRLYIFNI